MYQPLEIPLPPIPVVGSPPNAIPEEAKPFHRELGSQYMFQYSQCTGARKVFHSSVSLTSQALIIGINYIGQPVHLNGCINDARNISMFLNQRYGFFFGDMVILTDDNPDPRSQPTKDNIIRAMKWLAKDAMPHDSLFFHYSGHGGQSVDLHWNNVHGYDDTIYPVDFNRAGQINSEVHLRLAIFLTAQEMHSLMFAHYQWDVA
jgi:hypothetical protein